MFLDRDADKLTARLPIHFELIVDFRDAPQLSQDFRRHLLLKEGTDLTANGDTAVRRLATHSLASR